jgi:hypothetical protein
MLFCYMYFVFVFVGSKFACLFSRNVNVELIEYKWSPIYIYVRTLNYLVFDLSDKKFAFILFVLFPPGIPIYDDCVAYHDKVCPTS